MIAIDPNNYKWRDRTGEYITPKSMPTKRLFYTWLMIWNHIVPSELRIWNNHMYTFDYPYTYEYLVDSMKFLWDELKTRTDIGPRMKSAIVNVEDNKRVFINELLTKMSKK